MTSLQKSYSSHASRTLTWAGIDMCLNMMKINNHHNQRKAPKVIPTSHKWGIWNNTEPPRSHQGCEWPMSMLDDRMDLPHWPL